MPMVMPVGRRTGGQAPRSSKESRPAPILGTDFLHLGTEVEGHGYDMVS